MPEPDDLSNATPEPEDLRRTVDALRAQIGELTAELDRWRTLAVGSWSETLATAYRDHATTDATEELARVRASLSWRVTAPLRAVRRLVPRR